MNNSRFVDPISVVPFLAPDFKESECHIAKDTELYLTEFKPNWRGITAADDCDTYVFKVVKNFNTLNSPRDISDSQLSICQGCRLRELRRYASPKSGLARQRVSAASITSWALSSLAKVWESGYRDLISRKSSISSLVLSKMAICHLVF